MHFSYKHSKSRPVPQQQTFPMGVQGVTSPAKNSPPPCEIYASGGGLLIVPTNALLLWYQWWYWSCWSRDNHKAKIDDTSFRFCRDYDLCATCEKRGADVHDPSHVLLKMSLPCNKAQLSRVCVEGVLRRCITESARSVFVPDLTKTTPLNVVQQVMFKQNTVKIRVAWMNSKWYFKILFRSLWMMGYRRLNLDDSRSCSPTLHYLLHMFLRKWHHDTCLDFLLTTQTLRLWKRREFLLKSWYTRKAKVQNTKTWISKQNLDTRDWTSWYGRGTVERRRGSGRKHCWYNWKH